MLKELIEKYYQDKRDERDKVKFYISDAGKCPRQTFFKFKKAPRAEMEPRILRIFDQGDYVHLRLMRDLFSLGIVVASEINIPPLESIGGRADAIVSIDKELYLVDFKSINSSILRSLTEPKDDHLYQIQLYLHFFKLKKGILLYEGKDTLELKEFLVEYNPELAQKLLQEFDRLKVNLERDLIPDQLSDYPKNWQCQYCQFREICDRAGPGNVNWKEFKVKLQSQE